MGGTIKLWKNRKCPKFNLYTYYPHKRSICSFFFSFELFAQMWHSTNTNLITSLFLTLAKLWFITSCSNLPKNDQFPIVSGRCALIRKLYSATAQTRLIVQTYPNVDNEGQKKLKLSIWTQKLMKTAPVTCLLHENSSSFRAPKTVNSNENLKFPTIFLLRPHHLAHSSNW